MAFVQRKLANGDDVTGAPTSFVELRDVTLGLALAEAVRFLTTPQEWAAFTHPERIADNLLGLARVLDVAPPDAEEYVTRFLVDAVRTLAARALVAGVGHEDLAERFRVRLNPPAAAAR